MSLLASASETLSLLLLIALFRAIHPSMSWAEPKGSGVSSFPVCGVLEKYSGVTQIVDDERLEMLELRDHAPIPCGSSVSVESGWSQIRHRDGSVFHLAQGSYVQLIDGSDGHGEPAEKIVLYRGELFGEVQGGEGQLRVLTPNSRVRLERGSVIVSFDQEQQRTQLIAVDGVATLENRFEDARRTSVRAGQFSSLDFKLLRVIPSVSKPIDVASLRKFLGALHVPADSKARAIAFARKSRDEAFSPATASIAAHPSISGNKKPIKGSSKPSYAATDPREPAWVSPQNQEESDEAIKQGHASPNASRSMASVDAGDDTSSVSQNHAVRKKKNKTKHTRLTVQKNDGPNGGDDPEMDQERNRILEDLSKIRSD